MGFLKIVLRVGSFTAFDCLYYPPFTPVIQAVSLLLAHTPVDKFREGIQCTYPEEFLRLVRPACDDSH